MAFAWLTSVAAFFVDFGWIGVLVMWAIGTYLTFILALILWSLVILLGRIMERVYFAVSGHRLRRPHTTMFILGSGGHTQELLNLVPSLNANYPRIYMRANSDQISLTKAQDVEQSMWTSDQNRAVRYLQTYRIREVGQSWLTVLLFTGPLAFCHAAIAMMNYRPAVIICNGPGICVPFCVIGFIFTKLRLFKTRIVFVESLCRVRTLSMTGKILIRLADEFIVQWRDLKDICEQKYPKAKVVFLGRLT